jgi:hypothetical protein
MIFFVQKLQTGLIPNSALTKRAMQKYTLPMTNCSDIALIESMLTLSCDDGYL